MEILPIADNGVFCSGEAVILTISCIMSLWREHVKPIPAALRVSICFKFCFSLLLSAFRNESDYAYTTKYDMYANLDSIKTEVTPHFFLPHF